MKPTWDPGLIKNRRSSMIFYVDLRGNRQVRRHSDQIRKSRHSFTAPPIHINEEGNDSTDHSNVNNEEAHKNENKEVSTKEAVKMFFNRHII